MNLPSNEMQIACFLGIDKNMLNLVISVQLLSRSGDQRTSNNYKSHYSLLHDTSTSFPYLWKSIIFEWVNSSVLS